MRLRIGKDFIVRGLLGLAVSAGLAGSLALADLLARPVAAGAPSFEGSSDGDWCDDDDERFGSARHCDVREITLPASGAYNVDARPNGGVRVRGVEGGEARLQVKVTATAETQEEARALAGRVRIETAGTIRAAGPERSGHGRGWSVSYRLEVPRRSDLRLEADNGGLSVEDVVGRLEMQTMNGGLHLDGVGGRVHGQTRNGGLHVSLSGEEWEGEGLDLRTTNGGVHLTIPAEYNARLESGTVNGGVHSDLPVTGRVTGGRGHRPGGRIETDLGRGGSLLHLETTNGGLHVGRR
jgi:hypothetical protein